MSYQVLARKYRPQRFADVIGQPHVTRTLKNAIERQRIAHGYIFSGHRGIGKTTVARILAMALNCRSTDHPVPEPCGACDSCIEIREGRAVDVIEIDAATNRGIDEIRELRDAARYRPARDRYKVYILDEAHQITDAAFNALLKTLEEPPGHIIFMMATTQPEDIPQTIRSRCQHFSFHAVKFDDIVAQLRSIAGREDIQADDEALALLADAGDGSLRDALSILDQAIAGCCNRLDGESVRGLVGSVPAEVLEEMMQAVSQGYSQEVLRLVDRVVTEGQSPAHFARQMVRFLRNAMVAKVAGADSALLQISSDERARAGRVAALFGEEDLARFLQIMLRTHSELGYKQEQRFHLELGLLKLVHAQRLLPVEELLSQAAAPVGRTLTSDRPGPGQGTRSAAPAGTRPSSSAPPSPTRAAQPSPFEQDRSRKSSAPESLNPFRGEMSATPVVQGTIAVSVEAMAKPAPAAVADVAALRQQVVAELERAGQNMLAGMLDSGEWSLEGGEVVVRIARPQAFLDMTMGAEPKRIATQAAGTAVGRPVKLRVISGGTAPAGNGPVRAERPAAAGTARARAAEDPVVRRMQEKFGAEIRTVIDHRERK